MKGEVQYIPDDKIFHGSIPRVMGTRLELLAAGVEREKMEALWDSLYDIAFSLDNHLNRFDPTSEVSYLNMYDNLANDRKNE